MDDFLFWGFIATIVILVFYIVKLYRDSNRLKQLLQRNLKTVVIVSRDDVTIVKGVIYDYEIITANAKYKWTDDVSLKKFLFPDHEPYILFANIEQESNDVFSLTPIFKWEDVKDLPQVFLLVETLNESMKELNNILSQEYQKLVDSNLSMSKTVAKLLSSVMDKIKSWNENLDEIAETLLSLHSGELTPEMVKEYILLKMKEEENKEKNTK